MAASTLAYHVSRICDCSPAVMETELNRILAAGGTITFVVSHHSIVPIVWGNVGTKTSGYSAVDICYTTGK